MGVGVCRRLAGTAGAGRHVCAVTALFPARNGGADIGCGAGRDMGWLSAHAYAASGFDASEYGWRIIDAVPGSGSGKKASMVVSQKMQ